MGAIVGYLITTGILIWGLSLYQAGDAVALFGIVLTKQVFIYACLFWYGVDTYELLKIVGSESQDIEEETSMDTSTQENL
ncbi:MAG: hypothetical protein R2764_03380 [Bacteroidales bacterium]